jgi:hypothetical protein
MRYPTRHLTAIVAAAIGASTFLAEQPVAQQPTLTPDERVAALKQSLQESQARLRKYEWIETTVISLKGEEKNRKQQRCYYGADGKLQKVPVGDAPQAEESGGRRGRGGRVKQRIVENKKEDMQEYMERAASLVHHYVPPNPDDIDNAKKSGKFAVRPGQTGRARLEFTDYIKPGDLLTIDVDAAANRLVGLNVASYLDTPEDAVTLSVEFGSLVDGTSYTTQTTLDAKAKQVAVVIQNSGHRPVGQ